MGGWARWGAATTLALSLVCAATATGAPLPLDVETLASGPVRAGEPGTVTLRLANVSARPLPVAADGGALRVRNLLPAALAGSATATGRGWSCAWSDRDGLSCDWAGARIAAHRSTPDLVVRYRARATLRAVPSARPGGLREVRWSALVTRSGAAAVTAIPTSLPAITPARERPATRPARPTARLAAAVTGFSAIRAGGTGRLRVLVAAAGRAPVRGARAVVVLPRGLVVTHVSGWLCTVDDGGRVARCASSRTRSRNAPGPAIDLAVAAAPGTRPGTASARAVVTWTAGGPRRDTATTPVRILPRLGLDAGAPRRVAAAPRHGTRVDPRFSWGRTVVLSADVEGAVRARPARWSWRQVCPPAGCDAGTRARFLGPTNGAGARRTISARVAVPAVARATDLVFEARVEEGGAVARDRVTVRLTPRTSARSASRVATSMPGSVPSRARAGGLRVLPARPSPTNRPATPAGPGTVTPPASVTTLPQALAWAQGALRTPGDRAVVARPLVPGVPAGWNGTTTLTVPAGGGAVTVAVAAIGPAGEKASVTGRVAAGGAYSLAASMTGVRLTGSAGTLAATLAGTVSAPSPGAAPQVQAHGTASGTLLGDLAMDASVDWSAAGLAVSGRATAGAGADALTLSLAGAYSSARDWSARLTTAAPAWTVGDLSIAGATIAGSVATRRGVLTFSLSGAVQGLQITDYVDLSSAAVQLTNSCPGGGPRACDGRDLTLYLDLAGSVTPPGESSTAPFAATGTVDLGTGAIDLTGSVDAEDFGPAGLQLDDLTVTLSDGGAAESRICAPAGARRQSGGGLVFTFSAGLTILGEDAAVAGRFSDQGYCLQGELGDIDPGGGGANGASGFQDVALIYSSYATDVAIPRPGGGTLSHAVPAGSAVLLGGYTAPASLSGVLGGELAGQGSVYALVTDGAGGLGFDARIDYTLATPIYLAGQAGDTASTQIALTGVALKATYDGTNFAISLDGDGTLVTPAGTGSGSAVAPTTFGITAAATVTLGTQASLGFSMSLSQRGPVEDAFGQPGLSIRDLTVSGTVGANDSLGVAAGLTLPDAWQSTLGTAPGVPAQFALDVSDETPCLQVSVGRPGARTQAIDFFDEGLVTADYVNLLIAPNGCSFGAGPTIAPGFAFDFDGTIGSTTVRVNIAATPSAGPGSAFAVAGNVLVADWTVLDVDLQRATLKFNFDPATSAYGVSFGASVAVAESTIDVSGAVDSSPQALSISFGLTSSQPVTITIAGQSVTLSSVAFAYTDAGGATTVDFSFDGGVDIFGEQVAGTVALAYDDGALQTAQGDLDVDLGVGIAGVDGTLVFDYARAQGTSVQFTGSASALGFTADPFAGSLATDGAYSVSGTVAGSNPNLLSGVLYDAIDAALPIGVDTPALGYQYSLGFQIAGGDAQATDVQIPTPGSSASWFLCVNVAQSLDPWPSDYQQECTNGSVTTPVVAQGGQAVTGATEQMLDSIPVIDALPDSLLSDIASDFGTTALPAP